MDSTTIINQQQDQPENQQQSHGSPTVKSSRNAAVNALAVVGFLALIFIGIGLAIYSSQFVPAAVNQLSSNGSSNTTAPLGVVPTQNTTLPFPNTTTAATTTTIASTITEPGATTIPNSALPTETTQTTTAAPVGQTDSAYTTTPNYAVTAGAANALYGLPNLSVNIVAVGYLANGSTNNFASFVASPVIPVGARAAVEFSIANTGTNATGPWNFIANIPTDNGYVYTSPTEENMNPGDHILFTLAFDQVPPGNSEPVTVIADPHDYLQETTKTDNTATAVITVAQS